MKIIIHVSGKLFLIGLRKSQKTSQSYAKSSSSSDDLYVDSGSEYIPFKDDLSFNDMDDPNTSVSSGVEAVKEKKKLVPLEEKIH